MPALAFAVLTLPDGAAAGLAATADPDLVADLDRATFVDTRDVETCTKGFMLCVVLV